MSDDRSTIDWEKLFRKYIWDEEKTPYLVAVPELRRIQADYEVFLYSVFMGILFSVVAVASTTDASPYGHSLPMAFYGFSVVCATVILLFSKFYWSAVYCAAAPAVTLAFLFLVGFPPKLASIDHLLIVGLLLGWLRYSVRVVSISKHYPDLSETSGQR